MKTMLAILQIAIGFLLLSTFVSCTPAQANTPETEMHGGTSTVSSQATGETSPTATLVPTHTATFPQSPTATVSPFPTTPPVYTVVTRIAEKDGMEMVFVPAGAFEMGSSEGNRREQPVRQVYLDAYWIDKVEVTIAMFQKFVNETGWQTDAEKKGWSWAYQSFEKDYEANSGATWRTPHPGFRISGLQNHPVVHVSWFDAQAYCEWAGRKLPTDAEWEKAARGADGRTYPWGNQDPDGHLANFADVSLDHFLSDKNVDDGYQFTAPVGSYPAGASPYGALDMAGNVSEWVHDWYCFSCPNDSLVNPVGPDSGDERLMRGGGWSSGIIPMRSWRRLSSYPDSSAGWDGFRCALSHFVENPE
jgi:eukaryotic-like serine/threonine-protein kinase